MFDATITQDIENGELKRALEEYKDDSEGGAQEVYRCMANLADALRRYRENREKESKTPSLVSISEADSLPSRQLNTSTASTKESTIVYRRRAYVGNNDDGDDDVDGAAEEDEDWNATGYRRWSAAMDAAISVDDSKKPRKRRRRVAAAITSSTQDAAAEEAEVRDKEALKKLEEMNGIFSTIESEEKLLFDDDDDGRVEITSSSSSSSRLHWPRLK